MDDSDAKSLYERALAMAQSGVDLAEVEILLQKSASLGSGDAYFAIGSWYFFGKHFGQSMIEAIKYYHKAAILGNIEACLELAVIYERGDYVDKNNEKVISYYVMAMSMNSGQAYYELARSFLYGLFTPKSKLIYENLMNKADELGYDERLKSLDEDSGLR